MGRSPQLGEEEIMDTTDEGQNRNTFEETNEPIQTEEAASESIENFKYLEVRITSTSVSVVRLINLKPDLSTSNIDLD